MSNFIVYNDERINSAIINNLSIENSVILPIKSSTSIPTNYGDIGKIAYDSLDETIMLSNGKEWTALPKTGSIGPVLVYQPGGTSSNNVFIDWPSLAMAASNIQGPHLIYFDSSIEQCIIPAGNWNLGQNVTFQGPPIIAGVASITIIDDGATFNTWPVDIIDLSLQSNSNSNVVVLDTGTYQNIYLSGQTYIGTSNVSILSLSSGGLFITMRDSAIIDGHNAAPFSSPLLAVILNDNSNLSSYAVSASNTLIVLVNSPSATYPQPGGVNVQGDANTQIVFGSCPFIFFLGQMGSPITGSETALSQIPQQFLPANFFGNGGPTLRINSSGFLSTDPVNPGTLQIRIYIGNVVVLDSTPVQVASNLTNSVWKMDALITSQSSTSVIGNSLFEYFTTGNIAALPMLNTSPITISAANTPPYYQALQFTAEWATPDINSITCTNCTIEVLYATTDFASQRHQVMNQGAFASFLNF